MTVSWVCAANYLNITSSQHDHTPWLALTSRQTLNVPGRGRLATSGIELDAELDLSQLMMVFAAAPLAQLTMYHSGRGRAQRKEYLEVGWH